MNVLQQQPFAPREASASKEAPTQHQRSSFSLAHHPLISTTQPRELRARTASQPDLTLALKGVCKLKPVEPTIATASTTTKAPKRTLSAPATSATELRNIFPIPPKRDTKSASTPYRLSRRLSTDTLMLLEIPETLEEHDDDSNDGDNILGESINYMKAPLPMVTPFYPSRNKASPFGNAVYVDAQDISPFASPINNTDMTLRGASALTRSESPTHVPLQPVLPVAPPAIASSPLLARKRSSSFQLEAPPYSPVRRNSSLPRGNIARNSFVNNLDRQAPTIPPIRSANETSVDLSAMHVTSAMFSKRKE